MIAELRKVARMKRGTYEGKPEYLLTGLECGEDKEWAFGGDARADARRGVLERIAREQKWTSTGGDAPAIFPRVVANELELFLKQRDSEIFYWVEVCGSEQLIAQSKRRRCDHDEATAASFRCPMKLTPQECFERLEREGLA